MIEWSETHLSIRDAFRKFCEAEVKPKLHAIEHEGEPPYEVLRKMVATFGIGDMARMTFAAQIAKHKAKLERQAAGEPPEPERDRTVRRPSPEAGMELAMKMIPIIELSRHSPGMVTALGVSMGLTS